MFNVDKKTEGKNLTLSIYGKLDTTTAPELDEVVKNELNGIEMLVFDISNLEYISSAGLRVLLAAQKVMTVQGAMVIRGVGEEIAEIFEVTGFDNIFTIE
ncbi:MAG: STAS domain-containing protein [Lachnospiraceae bacterium]|nr:STAS domain-containing protein [Lachnospiraceae bacterium]